AIVQSIHPDIGWPDGCSDVDGCLRRPGKLAASGGSGQRHGSRYWRVPEARNRIERPSKPKGLECCSIGWSDDLVERFVARRQITRLFSGAAG
ncbi:MAG TPA: hypothetical protein VGR96_03640, partial [Acidobacteriaceae bacterium]|nr:hypothetical protein [Acidobacteriaceae bacterium]